MKCWLAMATILVDVPKRPLYKPPDTGLFAAAFVPLLCLLRLPVFLHGTH